MTRIELALEAPAQEKVMQQNHEPVGLTQAAAHLAVVRSTLSIIGQTAAVLIGVFFLAGQLLNFLRVPEGGLREVYEIVLTCALGLPPLYQVTLRPIARLAAEHAAAAAETRFQAVAQATHDGIVIFDHAGVIQFANKAIERMHGYPSGALRGKSLEILLPEEMRPHFRENLNAFAGSGGDVLERGPLERIALRLSGERFPVEISVNVMAKKSRPQYVVVARDISARKQAEREIQERTTRLNALIANNPLAIVVSDKDLRVQMVNTAFEELFQYRSAEIAGLEIDTLVAPPELLHEAQGISEKNMRGDVLHVITRRRRKDGTLVNVELHAVPLLIDGQVEGGYGIYQDLTERMRAEEALRQSEANLKTILESLPVAVRIVAGDVIVYANPADARLHGYKSPQQEIGVMFTQHLVPEDREHVRDIVRRQEAGQSERQRYHVRRVSVDGREFDAECTVEMVEYEGQRARLNVIEDLTDRERLGLFEKLLPVCCVCGKIRNDQSAGQEKGGWERLDHYVARNSDAKLSHTFCPACLEEYRRREGLPAADSSV